MPRLAIARFHHEGNSFSPMPTGLDAFRARTWLVGEAARTAYRGTAIEGGGVVEFLDTHPAWHGTFLRMADTTPSGPVTREAFEAIAGEIVSGLREQTWDAVYLSLHGAMVVEGMDLADFEMIRRVRAAIGPDVPLGVSFDLHANLDPRTADLVNFAAGYKEHPHVDQKQTALLVLERLDGIVAGRCHPVGAIAKLEAILPSINMRTAEGPMAEIEAFARGLECDPRILDASPFGGFSYSDTAAAGGGAMVFADGDAALARAAAERIVAEFRRRLQRFYISLPDAATGIARAMASERTPAAVIDGGDNPASGGIADTPAMLRALLAAAPHVPCVFAYFLAPELVQRCIAAGVGGPISGTLGARFSDTFGAPVPFSGTVLRLTDGNFVNRGPMGHGVPVSLGPTAVIGIGTVQVIVTSLFETANDPGFFDLHGIDLAQVAVLCVKAKNHFRAGFIPICPVMIDIDAPGPAALDIASFRFRHAPPTLYPLQSRSA